MMARTGLVALCVVAIAFSGCVADGPRATPGGPSQSTGVSDESPPVKNGFRTLEHSNTGNAAMDEHRLRLVITDNGTWQSFWDSYSSNREPRPAAPSVDFARELVVVASQGAQSSAGHNITIGSIAWDEGGANRLTVSVTESSPGQDCGNAAVQTHPIHVIALERRTAAAPEAVFSDDAVTIDC